MILEVKNLSKKFRNTVVFEDISFSVNKGEIVCIKGKSGEGKTTLLRCINKLETPDKGSIKINERYLCREEDDKMHYASKAELQTITQDIGLVFQSFNLFPHMTVMENLLESPMFIKRMPIEKIKQRAYELIKQLELEGKEDNYPFQLSGGQKQRVAIARALITDPKIILADEPTGSLDSRSSDGVLKLFNEINNDGQTILMVTHSVKAASHAKRVLFIKDGSIYHQIYKANMSNEEMYTKISHTLTLIATGGDKNE